MAHKVDLGYGFIKAAYDSLNRPFEISRLCTVSNTLKTSPGPL